MRSRRREVSPIWRDVKYGILGSKGLPFVMNDGSEPPAYYSFIVQLDGNFLLQLDGERIRRLDKD